MKPTILIHLLKDAPRRFPGRRPQPFRYLVKDAGNNAFYEKSSENLTNRADAIDAIDAIMDVHGPDATVILREEGKPDRLIRQPALPPSRRVELNESEWAQLLSAVQNSDLVGAVVHHPRVLQRVVELLNGVISPQYARGGVLPPGADVKLDLSGHPAPRGNVYDFTATDIAAAEAQIKRQEGQS